MRESENHIRPTIDVAPLMLWAAGPDRRCVFFNQEWLEFAGRTFEEQLRHDWLENVHADDRARCAALYSSAVARHAAVQFECRLCRCDGELRRAVGRCAARFTASGQLAGFVGVFMDIHEMGPSMAESEAGARRLSSIGTLAAGVAHDFNNLLANILANAELALTEAAQGSRVTDELDRIRTVAIRGSEIVRELLVYAGQEESHQEAVDLSKLVEEMLEILRISVTRHATIHTELAHGLPPVMADPAELRELLMNLILNASDALGDRSGEIRISTSWVRSRGAAADNETARQIAGDCVQLIVADSGSGIAPSVQSRMFDPFVSTKQPGRGVGLAIVRNITEKYGGGICVTSAPGHGTCFTVLLPCGGAQAEMADTEWRVSAAGSGEGKTVLIVDDEEGLRLAVSQLLRREGFRVIEARDGHSAVELLRTRAQIIDTILLDVTIPGMASEAVAEEAARVRPDVRIILTSAYSRGSAAPAYKVPQVRGFLRKPYQIGELVRLLCEEVHASSASGSALRH